MEINQSNQLRSYKAVTVVLETYKPVWTDLPAFGRAVTGFTGIVAEINRQAQIQLEGEQASEEKLFVLRELGKAAYEVSAAVQAYAVVTGNVALEARVDFSRSAIMLGKEDQIVSRCWSIQELATSLVDELADYGITTSKLNALKKKIEGFETVQPKPRNRRNKVTVATVALETLFREASVLLRKRMDKLVPQFADASPEFVQAYESARVVVDTHGPAKAKVPSTPAPQPA